MGTSASSPSSLAFENKGSDWLFTVKGESHNSAIHWGVIINALDSARSCVRWEAGQTLTTYHCWGSPGMPPGWAAVCMRTTWKWNKWRRTGGKVFYRTMHTLRVQLEKTHQCHFITEDQSYTLESICHSLIQWYGLFGFIIGFCTMEKCDVCLPVTSNLIKCKEKPCR